MASIYQQSYLTLSARAARDGSEGLFKSREVETCSLELFGKERQNQCATLLARRGRRHDCFRGAQDEWMSNDSEPLMTRAWVYQERLLSRRLLHFASDEMGWECQTTSDCECGPMPNDSSIAINRKEKGFTDDGGMSDRSVFEVLYISLQKGTDAESQRWYQLIKNYTLLNIMKDEDRLPAFSGIASSLIKDENYMAGIRKDHVVRDLLWYSLSGTKPRRPTSYLAPSWSWASLISGLGNFTTMYDHPSEWDASGTNILAECKEIFTLKSTSDSFGRLKGGELHIRGCNIRAKILETDKKDWIGSDWGPHRLRVEFISRDAKDWGNELKIDTIEDARAVLGASVSLLALWSTENAIYFLVLVKRSALSRKFRRIGVTKVSLLPQISGQGVAISMKSMLDKAPFTDFVVV